MVTDRTRYKKRYASYRSPDGSRLSKTYSSVRQQPRPKLDPGSLYAFTRPLPDTLTDTRVIYRFNVQDDGTFLEAVSVTDSVEVEGCINGTLGAENSLWVECEGRDNVDSPLSTFTDRRDPKSLKLIERLPGLSFFINAFAGMVNDPQRARVWASTADGNVYSISAQNVPTPVTVSLGTHLGHVVQALGFAFYGDFLYLSCIDQITKDVLLLKVDPTPGSEHVIASGSSAGANFFATPAMLEVVGDSLYSGFVEGQLIKWDPTTLSGTLFSGSLLGNSEISDVTSYYAGGAYDRDNDAFWVMRFDVLESNWTAARIDRQTGNVDFISDALFNPHQAFYYAPAISKERFVFYPGEDLITSKHSIYTFRMDAPKYLRSFELPDQSNRLERLTYVP